MKKILLTMLGVALIAARASAQTPTVTVEKVDVNKLKAAITKSDAEIADAKKAAKATTWVKRGAVFADADAKPVNGLYTGMTEETLKASFGDVAPTEETVSGKTYKVYTYEHFKAYVPKGGDPMVEIFAPITVIDPAALDKAYDAYQKAYEINAKATGVGDGMNAIRTRSFEAGGTQYALGDYVGASRNFRRSFRAANHPTSPQKDTMSIYYAGMAAAYGNDYANSLEDLNKAIEMGYEVGGSVYHLKAFDLYNLGRKEETIKTLETGLARYPGNEDIIDMMLRYYAEEEGDPSSMVPIVQQAIAKNPQNPGLVQGLARIYDKLGQVDIAIETMKKAVAINPNDFFSNYFEGFYIVKKGDEMDKEMGKKTFTSRTESQAAMAEIYAVYKQAVAPLEKAYSINPSEQATLELLKNLTFRLREEPGIGEKYTKYNDLWNSRSGQ